jgi:endoglucanase
MLLKFRSNRLFYSAVIGISALAVTILPVAADTIVNPTGGSYIIETWWPVANSNLSGTQPFKAMVKDLPVASYTMTWSVDGGQANKMADSYDAYPHKESSVNVSGWNWHGAGPYHLTFKATALDGRALATANEDVTVGAIASPSPSASAKPAATTAAASTTTSAPAASGLYLDPNNDAAHQIQQWSGSRPADATALKKIAQSPHATWLGGWSGDVQSAANDLVSRASSAGALPVMVAYNVPGRDCGGYSAGGVGSPSGYRDWIAGIARGIANRPAMVILEPDAIANMTCLSSADQATRMSLLSDAVKMLKTGKGTRVYVDAGHSAWLSASDAASRLGQAGLAAADGFSLNVSNYQTTAASLDYGRKVSALTGGKHFVIDTSRNGHGPSADNQWCNPSGRGLGERPTLSTGQSGADAYLWVKDPGASDGNCNGGPSAGQWWADMALTLAQNAVF